MSIKISSALEQNIANDILYGLLGPLGTLTRQIESALSVEDKLTIAQNFIVMHLPRDRNNVVDMRDERVQAQFDLAMETMARNTVQKALDTIKHFEDLNYAMEFAYYSHEAKRTKSLQEYAKIGIGKISTVVKKTINRSPILKEGVTQVYQGLSKLGVVSEMKEDSEQNDFELIEGEDDWNEVETRESYSKQVSTLFDRWKANPSLLLQTEPTKSNNDYLRNTILPRGFQMPEVMILSS